MALSERERQMLEEMEEAIRAEDPRFASQMKGSRNGSGSGSGSDRRRIIIGVIGALAGLGLVLLGINTNTWIGVAGFVLIVAAVALAATPGRGGDGLGVVAADGSVTSVKARQRKGVRIPGRPGGASKPSRQGTFMERMEQRWEERRRQGPGL